MAIPKEKNLAVQLVPTVAFGVASFLFVRAMWYVLTGEHAPSWVAGLASISGAAAFFWWYGYMQRSPSE